MRLWIDMHVVISWFMEALNLINLIRARWLKKHKYRWSHSRMEFYRAEDDSIKPLAELTFYNWDPKYLSLLPTYETTFSDAPSHRIAEQAIWFGLTTVKTCLYLYAVQKLPDKSLTNNASIISHDIKKIVKNLISVEVKMKSDTPSKMGYINI